MAIQIKKNPAVGSESLRNFSWTIATGALSIQDTIAEIFTYHIPNII